MPEEYYQKFIVQQNARAVAMELGSPICSTESTSSNSITTIFKTEHAQYFETLCSGISILSFFSHSFFTLHFFSEQSLLSISSNKNALSHLCLLSHFRSSCYIVLSAWLQYCYIFIFTASFCILSAFPDDARFLFLLSNLYARNRTAKENLCIAEYPS